MCEFSINMTLDQRKSELIHASFIKMADMDYLTARWCYGSGIFHNFYWSADQAVEKYFKAALLYRNISVKKFGHNLNDLFDMVCTVDINLRTNIIKMPDTTGYGREAWDGKPISLFVDYLNQYGSADARYSLAGTFINGPVIHPLDILCGRIRQVIRRNNFLGDDLFLLSQAQSYEHDRIKLDLPWMLHGDYLLESLFSEKYQVGQDRPLRDIFRTMNFVFFNERSPEEATFGGQHFTMSPMLNHLFRLRDLDSSEENLRIIDELRTWADTHIRLPKEIKDALRAPM